MIPYDVADPQTTELGDAAGRRPRRRLHRRHRSEHGLLRSALKPPPRPPVSRWSRSTSAERARVPKGVLACIACDSMVSEWGRLLGNWIIADSDAQANVGVLHHPGVLEPDPRGRGVRADDEEGCADCTVDVLESTIESFTAGGLVGEIASYIQTHPDTDYIYFAFGQMAAGVA